MSGASPEQIRELTVAIMGLTQMLGTASRASEKVAGAQESAERGERDRAASFSGGGGAGFGGFGVSAGRQLGVDAIQTGAHLSGGNVTPAGQALGLAGGIAGGAFAGAAIGGPAGAAVGGGLGAVAGLINVGQAEASLDLQQARLQDPSIGATAREIEADRIAGQRDPRSSLGRFARGAENLANAAGPLGALISPGLSAGARIAGAIFGDAPDPDVQAEESRQAAAPQMRAEARLSGMLEDMGRRGVFVDEEQRERIGQSLLNQELGAERGRRFAAEWQATRSDRTGTVD